MLNIKLSEEDNRVKEIPRTSNNAYLTFKNNGSVYFFHGILKGSTEKVLDLDKANIGFLVKFNNKNYLASYSPINCGSFSVNDFKVNGDTLAISAGSNKGHRIWYYYIKKDMDSPVNQIDW
ncbi:hypothetical protein [Tenacibaculum maritimum]|nr:hypothetical protein [Tenacibaculum maritimum]MCD9564258.1 hypothetical protein [Tenacibaculum maritimum]MCD9567085.1 hypothetical protein [Tenacibaculum maritimum]MCD9580293.1 hypothetical protein [Tenacibaculum maritimum]MCD9598054.1 hypothetical protein [Tenacibaculum maritimum]MCD9614955.1 hypothetical protein [Tenacibaculum maritimum]